MAALYPLFLLSGLAGLLYQVVWTKELVLLFGATSHAIGTTVAVFMLGLALGSRWLGARADRSARPLLLYAWLEAGIGATAMLSLLLLRGLDSLIAAVGFAEAGSPGFLLFRLAGCFAVLLPPTILMGGTLPLLAKICAGGRSDPGRRIGLLYALNTFGGMAGCLAAGFLGIPLLGMKGTLFAGVAANLLVAAVAVLLAGRAAKPESAAPVVGPVAAPEDAPLVRPMLVAFFLAGFCGLAAEVAWTRILLLQVTGTAQAFAAMLAVYLFGLAAGSAAAGRLADRSPRPARLYGALQVLVGLSLLGCLLWSVRLGRAPFLAGLDLILHHGGESPSCALAYLCACLALTAVLLLGPTFVMGLAVPCAVRVFAAAPAGVGSGIGFACMLNTLGAVAGSLAAGFLLVPALGLQATLVLCATLSFAGGTIVLGSGGGGLRRISAAAAFLLLTTAATALPEKVVSGHAFRMFPHLLFHREDACGTVFVAEERAAGTVRRLSVGATSMVTDSLPAQRYTRMIGHLPLLLHPKPERALVICFGSGMTLGAVAAHPDLVRIDCAELSAGVLAAAPLFERVNGGVLRDPRVRAIVNDGRTHLRVTRERYDAIALEPPPPNNAGVANLYSQEFYRLCRERLAPGGMVAQWLPLHSVTLAQARSLARTMVEVFPAVTLWHLELAGEYCLLGHTAPLPPSAADAATRFAAPAVRANLATVGIRRVEDLFAGFLLGPDATRRFAGDAPPVTDDRPGIGYDLSAFDVSFALFSIDKGRGAAALGGDPAGPSGFLRFFGEQDREGFQGRLRPAREAWTQLRLASEIASGFPLPAADSPAFIPPTALDPGNPYFEHAPIREKVRLALRRLAAEARAAGQEARAEAYERAAVAP